MAQKKSHITVTDQFCGAGGSSQGVRNLSTKKGGGIEVEMALNHWQLAIETHNTNFPNTRHDCTDVSACDPRRYPSTDILITSPECTTHSPAGGNNHKALKKQMDMFATGAINPATERSRATMWDVVRFTEYHKYNIVIVENVVEAKTRWALFDQWLMTMHALGYNHKCVYLNSMHCHPTPQSRDRMYVVFWKKGNKAPDLDLMPRAWCGKCGRDVDSVQTWKNPHRQFGKYDKQYVYCCPGCATKVEPYYYAAMNIIDWSNPGTRIGDRKAPLSPKTIGRIENGIDKYGSDPMLIHTAYSKEARGIARHITQPGFTDTTGASKALVGTPFIINDQHITGVDCRVKAINDRLPALVTDHRLKLLVPPFIIKHENGKKIHDVFNGFKTQTTTQSNAVVCPPFSFLTESHNNGSARSINDVTNTATVGGIKTGLVTNESWNAFLSYYNNGSHMASHITEASRTQATGERLSLVAYKKPTVDECYYRMLDRHEVKLSMAFAKDYIILGNAKDQVKQCGNAVTPPAMEFLVERSIESLN